MARFQCHEHTDRAMLAYCTMCSRPCCGDCTTEMLGDYFCETCKARVANQLRGDKVVPDALSAVIVSGFSVFMLGFVVGPYAIWRARSGARHLERFPWMRGKWHIRAAYVIAGFGTVMGIISLVGRLAGGA